MKLTMAERMRLLNVLPESGGIAEIRIANDLRLALAPSEEEYEEYGFFTDEEKPGMLFWNVEAEKEAEIKISKPAKKLIEAALLKVDEEGQVTVDLISLFDKFVIDEEGE